MSHDAAIPRRNQIEEGGMEARLSCLRSCTMASCQLLEQKTATWELLPPSSPGGQPEEPQDTQRCNDPIIVLAVLLIVEIAR